jgi:hypothetical protein
MRKKRNNGGKIRSGSIAVLILLSLMIIVGCASSSRAPGADITAGVVENAGYEFFRWDEGLAIMIWHDVLGESGSSSTSTGSGLMGGPVYGLQGYAKSWDGRRLAWQIETQDGKSARFSINGVARDLSKGTLFIVSGSVDGFDVRQLDRDLSGVRADQESCVDFARSDATLRAFMRDNAVSLDP